MGEVRTELNEGKGMREWMDVQKVGYKTGDSEKRGMDDGKGRDDGLRKLRQTEDWFSKKFHF